MRVRRFERNILYTIITFGLLIRIYHLYKWRIWGSDSGEYLYLTRYLVKHGQMLIENYIGWGRAYPDFQGMQLLTGSISLITGISYHETLLWFIPLIAGLSVPMLFILGKKMVGFKAALFGSAFYSVTFAVVYANSHPMPGSLAEPLSFTFIYAWIKSISDVNIKNKWNAILIFSLAGMMITHHFTSLLMMASVMGILCTEIGAGNKLIAKPSLIVLGLFSTLLAIYWLVYAISFREMLDESAFAFLPENVPVLFVLLIIPLASLLIVWALKEQITLPLQISDNITHTKFLYRIGLAFAISIIVILLALWKGVPGTEIPVGLDAIPYLSVNLAWITLTSAPLFVLSKSNGWLIYGWMVPIIGLASIGAITGSHLLIAYRHAPYILAPLTLLAGVGGQYLISGFSIERRPIVSSFFILLFLGCAATAYPPPTVMGGFQEGTNEREFGGILWTQFAEEDSLIVSDHRLSSMTFGLTETNASWENGAEIITGTSDEALAAGEKLLTPRAGIKPVSYIMLSNEMQEGVALLQWDPAKELTGEAKSKFTDNEDFPLWFDNGDLKVMRMRNSDT